MSDLPKSYQKTRDEYSKVFEAYEKLGAEVHGAGPINDKNRSLIKLAIAVGARMEGAVHSHTRKALEAGCTKEEIKQTVLLALPTIGMPNMMASMTWVNDILES